jgi:hypothetical protein
MPPRSHTFREENVDDSAGPALAVLFHDPNTPLAKYFLTARQKRNELAQNEHCRACVDLHARWPRSSARVVHKNVNLCVYHGPHNARIYSLGGVKIAANAHTATNFDRLFRLWLIERGPLFAELAATHRTPSALARALSHFWHFGDTEQTTDLWNLILRTATTRTGSPPKRPVTITWQGQNEGFALTSDATQLVGASGLLAPPSFSEVRKYFARSMPKTGPGSPRTSVDTPAPLRAEVDTDSNSPRAETEPNAVNDSLHAATEDDTDNDSLCTETGVDTDSDSLRIEIEANSEDEVPAGTFSGSEPKVTEVPVSFRARAVTQAMFLCKTSQIQEHVANQAFGALAAGSAPRANLVSKALAMRAASRLSERGLEQILNPNKNNYTNRA